MAVTYGFFNSLDSDRLYNADQMSNYFKGLITNGVYETVDDAMIVKATTGMVVTVGKGRAIIDCKWINIDALVEVTLSAAHVTLNRYSAICVHLDVSNRLMEIVSIDGTNATTPTKPVPENTSTDKYLVLAYVYVGAGVTAITQSNITDTRGQSVCGWVTGLIEQVDTSQLFLQWQTAFETYYANMTVQFDDWFETLTDQLNVNTYVDEFRKRAVLDGTEGGVVELDMLGYSYTDGDIIDVYINGLYGDPGYDYTFDRTTSPATITTEATAAGTVVSISVKKSRIGFTVLTTSDGNILVTDNNEEISI